MCSFTSEHIICAVLRQQVVALDAYVMHKKFEFLIFGMLSFKQKRRGSGWVKHCDR